MSCLLRSEINTYMRDTFDVHKSIKKIGIRVSISVQVKLGWKFLSWQLPQYDSFLIWQGESKGVHTVRNDSTVDGFFATVENLKTEMMAPGSKMARGS